MLEPHINRIKALLFFKVDAIQKFCTNLHLLARAAMQKPKDKEFSVPCEALYMQVGCSTRLQSEPSRYSSLLRVRTHSLRRSSR